MGFMDKAKKLAEQAQTKLDEVQKDFNEKQGTGGQQPTGAAVEYDAHGRKITPPEDRLVPEAGPSHTQGDPADDFPSAPSAPADTAQADPPAAAPEAPADKSPTFPPKPKQPPSAGSGMSSGDPLAG